MLAKRRTTLVLAGTFIILMSAFWFFPAFAFIFFISLLLHLLLDPAVDFAAKKLPRGLAALLVLLAALLIVVGLGIIVSVSFIPTFTSFIKDLPSLTLNIQQHWAIQEYPLIAYSLDMIRGEIANTGSTALKSSLTLVLSFFNKLIDFVIILFVTFYLIKDGKQIKSFIANLFPKDDNHRIMLLMDKMLKSLQIYIRSQLLMCCITAVIVYLYFTILDLKYASVFAVLSGVCEFVPVLGPTIASVFGITLTATDNPMFVIQTALFYLILTQINHNVVYPGIVGKSLNLHPMAIILGVILGGELLDTAGMFLAVPAIVIIKHLIEDIHEHEKKL